MKSKLQFTTNLASIVDCPHFDHVYTEDPAGKTGTAVGNLGHRANKIHLPLKIQ